MTMLRWALVCVVAAVLVPVSWADDKALLTAKPWKVAKSDEAPAGTTFRFTAAGAVTVQIPLEGKVHEMNGTYTLSGTTLTMKITHNGKERVDVRTIKKLTDATLVTEDKNRKVEEFQH